ncbi:MAG: ribosome biogenesis GTPase Der [Marinilabiliales bacterium]|nr:MAG: ribosome biogenesis GTPase Der [Marinilabiliales bacterium]
MSNIIAIVGRPNVGKSTLFNRLTGMRQAIVDSISGVTRDRHYGKSDWNGKEFSVIDTGGYIVGSDDVFEAEIRKQVDLAMGEADVILFVADAQEGVTPLDEEVANIIRRSPKPVFMVVNKSDNPGQHGDAMEFYSLGIENLFPVSAINGSGTGELLDAVVEHFQIPAEDEGEDQTPRIAVVGRPNVGKSSFINALLGKDRNIVTNIAGTTRDSIFTPYTSYGFNFMLVDTAGLRKKNKEMDDIEFYSVMRSVRAIEHADVCLLIIDAERGIEAQDLNIFQLIQRNNKGVVIAVNKWDLIAKDSKTHIEFEQRILERIAPFTDVPIVFTSVTQKQRIHKTLEIINQVHQVMKQRIPTSELNNYMLPIIENTPPPAIKGKQVKIKYITQLKKDYPVFVFFCNLPQYVKDPYKRFLENKLRERFHFTGVPVKIFIRKK